MRVLKKLRIEFVLITMSIVGAVLFTALSFSFYSSYSTQHELTSTSLEQALEDSFRDKDDAQRRFGPDPGQPERKGGFGIFALVIEVDESRDVVWTNNTMLTIDDDELASVVDVALSSKAETGESHDLGLAWRRAQTETGRWRVAIVDITTRDALLRGQLINVVAIFFGTMLILLIVVLRLAYWVLQPVEKAWEQQRTFIADASHELKTPLSAIIASLTILKSDKAIPAESYRWVESAADEASHMKDLVNELLELARADEASSIGTARAMAQTECDLSKLVEGAVLEYDAVAYERGCEIESLIEGGISITCDPAWLERAVKILLDNATKYAAQGSTVTTSLAREGHKVRFSVANRGQVIDEADLARIFDRFYRTDKARQRESEGGFGLGLAIAKSIVEAHGGTISATSDAEAGTVFTFVI